MPAALGCALPSSARRSRSTAPSAIRKSVATRDLSPRAARTCAAISMGPDRLPSARRFDAWLRSALRHEAGRRRSAARERHDGCGCSRRELAAHRAVTERDRTVGASDGMDVVRRHQDRDALVRDLAHERRHVIGLAERRRSHRSLDDQGTRTALEAAGERCSRALQRLRIVVRQEERLRNDEASEYCVHCSSAAARRAIVGKHPRPAFAPAEEPGITERKLSPNAPAAPARECLTVEPDDPRLGRKYPCCHSCQRLASRVLWAPHRQPFAGFQLKRDILKQRDLVTAGPVNQRNVFE